MVDISEAASSVGTFKSLWAHFLRSFARLSNRTHIAPEDEAVFLDAKNALIERYRRLIGEPPVTGMPEALAEGMYRLSALTSIASLSDAEFDELKRVIRAADDELDEWADVLKRKDVFRAGLEKSARHENLKMFVGVPLFFGALVVLFVALGLKFFLNR